MGSPGFPDCAIADENITKTSKGCCSSLDSLSRLYPAIALSFTHPFHPPPVCITHIMVAVFKHVGQLSFAERSAESAVYDAADVNIRKVSSKLRVSNLA